MNIKSEEISPAIAHKYLAASGGNRAISESYVASPNVEPVVPSKGGVIYDLPREKYDAIKGRENWSRLKLIGGENGSPALYRHILDNPPEPDTDARARGRVTHLATFQPHLLESVAIWEGARRAGKEWEAFEAEHKRAGHEIIPRKLYDDALAIGRAARQSPMAAPYLARGRMEVTILWRYEERPVLDEKGEVVVPGFAFDCKGLVDFVADMGCLVDLKTTRSARPGGRGFGAEVAKYEYLAQAAFYADGYALATGQRLPFAFVAVETKAPFITQVHLVDDDQLEVGREIYKARLATLNHCRTRNEWFGYAPGPVPLELPKWAAPFEEDDVGDLGLVIGG